MFNTDLDAIVPMLCVMALVMGIVPTLFTKPMEPAVRRLVERVQGGEPVQVRNSIQNSQFRMQTASAAKVPGDIVLASQPGDAAR